MVSPFPLKTPILNYRDIYLKGALERGEGLTNYKVFFLHILMFLLRNV